MNLQRNSTLAILTALLALGAFERRGSAAGLDSSENIPARALKAALIDPAGAIKDAKTSVKAADVLNANAAKNAALINAVPQTTPATVPSPTAVSDAGNGSGTATTAQVDAPVNQVEDYLKVRDPFKRPDLELKLAVPRSDLEKYPADSFKMIGVLTGPEHIRAMLLAPNGKTYLVAERSRIGLRNGFILKIGSDQIQVREKIMNAIGKEENLDMQLQLRPERSSDTASVGTSETVGR